MQHNLLRQRASDDVGHLSNEFADTMQISAWDMHADEMPNRDDNVRLFLDTPIPKEPWRRYVEKGEPRRQRAESINGSHSILLSTISGQRSRMRETNFEYGLWGLRRQWNAAKISAILLKTPHDRNERAFINKITEEPEYNVVIGQAFPEKLARYADHFFGIGLHANESKQHFIDAFGEKNCSFMDTGNLIAQAVSMDYPDEIKAQDIVIITPDSGNKLDREPLVDGIVRGLNVHNALYPGNTLNLSGHFNERVQLLHQAPNFDALGKERDSEYDVHLDEHGIDSLLKEKIKDKIVLLVDDTTDTMATLITAAEALLKAGARAAIAGVTHPVLAHYKRGKEKELEDGTKVGNALAYADQKTLNGQPVLSRIYTFRTIPNIDRRIQQIVENGNRGKFRVLNPASLIVPALFHACDLAEGKPRRPLSEIPDFNIDLFNPNCFGS